MSTDISLLSSSLQHPTPPHATYLTTTTTKLITTQTADTRFLFPLKLSAPFVFVVFVVALGVALLVTDDPFAAVLPGEF